jgi:riboflavin-specific deaminase-like protein
MRRLLPEPTGDIDPFEAYRDVTAPWLRIGMVMSTDGSATDAEGWTDALGGEADARVFRTLRALADGILVGAATVRTGRMGPARLRPALRDRRGRPPAPIIVVSSSLALDWTLPLFTAAETPTLVVTSAVAATRAAGAVPDAVRPHLILAGAEEVDLGAAVRELHRRGMRHLLCEGGPALATSLVAAGLVDELCLTVAPTLAGGTRHTRLLGDLAGPVDLKTAAVYVDGGVLFLRYLL